MKSPATGLKGLVKVDVVDHRGRTIQEGQWQPNLLLDQGLDQLATTVYCDLFKWAAKGNSSMVMREVVNTVNKYTLNTSTGVLTRTLPALDSAANARVFVDADATAGGDRLKTVRSANGVECVIVGVTSGSIAQVVPVGGDRAVSPFTAYGTGSSPAVATQTVTIFNTGLQGIDAESGRTETYSTVPGENSTTTAANVRTFQRTFLFDPEPENSELIDSSNAYGWSGSVVTRSAGTRNFTASDLGKYILFPGTGEFCKIVSIYATTDTSVPPIVTPVPSRVNVDRVPIASHVGLQIKLYGYNSYSHVGFSHSGDAGGNLNIMVRLENSSNVATPVLALGSNPEVPGQQVKITYKLVLTFTPNTIVSVGNVLGGDATAFGTNPRTGKATLEALATSIVSSDTGETDIGSVGLEPSVGGHVALSAVGLPLDVLGGTTSAPDRTLGVQFTDLTPDDYIQGQYTRTYSGTFGINNGNTSTSTLWKTLGIYEPQVGFLYSMLFDVVSGLSGIKKPPTHQLTLHFRKSWNRDLS